VFHYLLPKMHPCRLASRWIGFICLLLCVSSAAGWAQESNRSSGLVATENPQTAQNQELRVKELIEMLGSDQFATRQRAQIELELMGLDAFEALREAFDHPDREVASMAKYLLNSAKVEWANENDPPAVREILKNYDVRSVSQKKTMMDRLAFLPKRDGWAPLCRIAKFEPNNGLSKYAALLLLQKRKDLSSEDRNSLVDLVRREVGQSRRTSVQWLQNFSALLVASKPDTKAWYAIAENEHALLDSGSDDTFPQMVQSLYEWCALLGTDASERDNALRMARGAIRIVGNDPMGLRNASFWAIDNSFSELVEEMQLEHQALFTKYAELTYCLAESFRARKMEPSAQEFADVAFKNPSVGMFAARDPREYRTLRAYNLKERGLFDWSEREYLETIKSTRLLDVVGLRARYYYSDLLHDLERNTEAGEVWKDILLELEGTGETYRQQLHVQLDLAGLSDPAGVIGQAYYYQGLAYMEKGDNVQAKIKLNYAFDNDPDNADVLIAMYRIEGDEQWKRTVLQRVQTCADYFQSQMIQKEQEMESGGALGMTNAKRELATMNNQYAWLISNTEGDMQQALRCSQRSLELEPELSTFLDTLGRCYYAVGDYQNAVAYQSKATKLEPFSMAMKRQLALFEAALQQQKEKKQ